MKEKVPMDRCFWKELTTGVTIYKNEEIIEHNSVTLTVDPHQIALYGFWCHTDNQTGKELIFLNTASNNYLEGTNYNYGCRALNDPVNCMEDYAMPEIRTINGMQNIPSCSTIVSLKASDVIPVTKFCIAIKLINNTESNSVGIKSLSGSCDLKIQDKAGSIIIISIDEGSYRFFADLYGISCEFRGEGNHVNCSDKTPEIIRPRDQGFDEAAEKIVNITSDDSNNGLNIDQISFKDLFNSKYQNIMWTIIIIISVIVFITILIVICYCYCNRTKVAITAASGQTN
jgi:hypothetical protein